MSRLIVTVDLDWACEAAIEEALEFFKTKNVSPTLFTTHQSRLIETNLNELDVGLHPYFGVDSSHGATISEVVRYVMELPHNLPVFRCHRFGICNSSRQAMIEAGMLLSSNVCTDLEVVPPFRDRFGLLEVPIFFEDGGFLWRKHPLEITSNFMNILLNSETKVILIHPMHFALNTPNFEYMYQVKQSLNRQEWNHMTLATLEKLRWKGRGIKDLLEDIFQIAPLSLSLKSLLNLN